MMHYGTANQESESEKFADGAYYATNATAAADRYKRETEIRKLEHVEYTYKNDFKESGCIHL